MKWKRFYNVRKSKRGGYYCFFYIVEQQYYADLCFTVDHGDECMIFEAKDNTVTNWSELYVSLVPVSKSNLIACIEEFIEENNNNHV